MQPSILQQAQHQHGTKTGCDEQHSHGKRKRKSQVVVRYIAAEEPFKDEYSDCTETVDYFKARVLAAVSLIKGQMLNGNTVSYRDCNKIFAKSCN